MRSWMVMGRLAGSVTYFTSGGEPVGGGTATTELANAGRYFPTGSFRRNLPSSYNMSAATVVTALLIEAMRKMASVAIGW